MPFPVPTKTRYPRMDDERLAALAGTGDAAAFEALYDRHHAALLAFCRHMLGNREDGEDALQQAFVRAHRALTGGRAPDRVRPWLFAIARNRCLTLISARREAALPADDLEPSFDGLAADVQRRADLRELVTDLARLPEDQREALVLAELGDFSHTDIAHVVGCAPEKVKALVFQARTTLIADRDARRTPCEEIRALLDTARGGLLRRGSLRRHLRQCDPCAAYRAAVDRQRAGLAIVLPVAPTAGLKAGVLAGAGGLGGAGAESAAAAVAATAAAAPGTLAAPVAGGVAVKALAAKAAIVATIAAGGGAAVQESLQGEPPRAVESASAAEVAGATGGDEVAGVGGPGAPATGGDDPDSADGGPGGDGSDGTDGGNDADDAADPADATPGGPRLRRVALRLADGDPRARRRVRQRLQRLDPEDARRIRRRLIRARRRIAADPLVRARIERRRRRGGLPTTTEQAPEPIGATEPDGATEPVAGDPVATSTPEPRPRRRRRPRPAPRPTPLPAPAPTPAPTAEPTPEPAPEPALDPTPEPTPEATAEPAP